MSYRVATTLSPFKPNQESLHWARWEKDSSECSSSFSAHHASQRNKPQYTSMVRNLRRTDPDPKARVGTSTHRDFRPHSAQLDKVQVVNTRDSAMSHLDPSKTFTNVTNPDDIYRSEKDVKFRPPSGGSLTHPISLPPCRIFPTREFHDQTTSRDYHAYDLSQASPTRVLARGRQSSTRGDNQFEGVSSSQHDYPPHIVHSVRTPALQPSPVSLGAGPLTDATVHKQFFIPHIPAPAPPIVPPGYKKESLCFEGDTSYNTFFSGHRGVSRAPRYEPINGEVFSSLQSDMRTQTALHFPPKSVTPYFAPVPVTYRPPEGPLGDQTSQKIDFPGNEKSRPAASAKPAHRPITGDFLSSRTHADTFQPIPLSKRPPPAVDKHGISLPQDPFLSESTTKSAYTGGQSQPPLPFIPVPTHHGHTGVLEHSSIYKSSYNCKGTN